MKKILIIIIVLIFGLAVYFNNKNINLKNLPKILEKKSTNVLKEEYQLVEKLEEGLSLEINEPKDGDVVNQPSLTIKGKTKPGVEVFVNEKELVSDSQGDFNTSLTLEEGENIITIVASDNEGNYAEKELVVTLETLD